VIDFYTYRTPNGRKIAIMLEECGLEYTPHVVDLMKGEHKSPAFEKISPDHTVPAIVDQEGPGGKPVRVFEAGAILQYLADKTGRFYGNNAITRMEATQWMMIVLTGLAPFSRECFFFKNGLVEGVSEEALTQGASRMEAHIRRYVSALDFRLREYQFLAKTYTIADMAAYPWVDGLQRNFDISVDDYVGVRNWYNRMSNRAAVQRGMAIP